MADSNRALKQDAAQRRRRDPALWTYVKAHPLGVAIGVPAGLAIGALCGIAAGPVGSLFGALIGGVLGALAAGGFNTSAGNRVDAWTWRREHTPPREPGKPPPEATQPPPRPRQGNSNT